MLKFSLSALFCALMLVGCSQNETIAPSPTSTTKDTIVIASGSEPATLDPQLAEEAVGLTIIRQMMEGLVLTDDDGKTIPGLAERWDNVDNKVWTFYLRDANWSNGEPITAHDAAFALKRLADPNTAAPYASYLADAKVLNADAIAEGKMSIDALGVVAVDDKTLQITLSEAVPYFADMMALPVTSPVPQKVVEQFGERWLDIDNIVVSGAYKLSNWIVNDNITLVKNDAYYNADNTKILNVKFLPVTGVGALNRYRTGEIDINGGIPPEQIEQVLKEIGNEAHKAPKLCNFYLSPNIKKAPFDDMRIRQALSMSIDRDAIVQMLKRGDTPAYQFTPAITNNMGEVLPDWHVMDNDARYAEAKRLLAEAGYGPENPLQFEFLYSTSDTGKMLSSAISSMWRQNLGGIVAASQLNQEWKTLLDNKRAGNFDLVFAGWCGDYNEASTFLNVLKSTSSNNAGGYNNLQFDTLLNNTLSEGADRQNLYEQAEAILAQETAVMPLYSPISVRLVKPYVEGFSNTDPLDYYYVKDLSFKQ